MAEKLGKNLANGITEVYNKKWSFVNTFSVNIEEPWTKGILTNSAWNDFDNEEMQTNIVSVDTSTLTSNNLEAFFGDQWFIHNGRTELFRFTITFRDSEEMNLFSVFSRAFMEQRLYYFDDVSLTVTIGKDADWLNQSDFKLVEYSGVLIDNVSQVQFSNVTENQVAEFSVTFKATTVNYN